MYLLVCLAILGSAIANPFSNQETQEIATTNDVLISQYVLPGESVPTFYDVELFFNPDNVEYFTGRVLIRVLPVIETNQLVLQAMEMTLDTIQVYGERDEDPIYDSHDQAVDDTHMLRITLNRTISPGVPHIIEISYTGRFAENMFGVYVSTYADGDQTVSLITSQLQPTFARRAFPCYDEPALKAIFRTTIYAPSAYTVVRSNTPERTIPLKPDVAGWDKHEFEDTLVMSSYLIAYLVSNFEHIDNEEAPLYRLPFKVFSRPGTRDNAEFAMEFGQLNMVALEVYTEFPYAFPKIDKAAVPDFAAGAMENWGLVIYREAALLVQDGVTTTNTIQNIARIICHENTHFWFGNEVGPQSWTYTWLNEGFANFFENFATDLVRPTYRMMDQFVLLLQGVMQNDAVLSVNPMTHPVFTPSQILGTFNAVAYQKSGSVIRMMQHFLTPEIFRRGLVIYIQNNSRRASAPANLYAALQQALDESDHSIPWPLAVIMDRWTNQGGFPVLTVRRSAATANSLVIAQERFLTDPTLSSNDRWHVPVTWVLSSDPNFDDTTPQVWVPPTFPAISVDIAGLSQADWYIVNKQETGYYRVNYDTYNWLALSRLLDDSHETIPLLNRAQIIDDAFNLARNGRLSYNIAFEISRFLIAEEDYIPWSSADAALSYIDIVLSGSEVYELFQTYVLEMSAPLFAQLGFVATDSEEFVTPYHRNIILNLNCRYGNEECVNRATELLQQFRNNPNQPLNPDIQTTIFCSGLRGGDYDNFNFLWELYEESDDPSQRGVFLNSLGCTSNETLRDFYLNQVIDDTSVVREQDRHSIIVAVINSSPENMEAALDFVVEHFGEIQPRVQGLSGTTNILNAFARRLNTQEHNEKIDDMVSRHNAIFTAGELASIAAIRENIGASITWTNQNLATVDAWLVENYGNHAGALTSSLFIIFSAIFAICMY